MKAVQFVLERGMLDPIPEKRPQTVDEARALLREALRLYEDCATRQSESTEEKEEKGSDFGEEGA